MAERSSRGTVREKRGGDFEDLRVLKGEGGQSTTESSPKRFSPDPNPFYQLWRGTRLAGGLRWGSRSVAGQSDGEGRPGQRKSSCLDALSFPPHQQLAIAVGQPIGPSPAFHFTRDACSSQFLPSSCDKCNQNHRSLQHFAARRSWGLTNRPYEYTTCANINNAHHGSCASRS